MKINLVNPTDRSWTRNRYILWFGGCAPTYLMVWANSLENALDECIDWLAEHAPGHLMNDEVAEAYQNALNNGMDEDEANEAAVTDMTCGGNCCHYIASWEWGIVAENPTRQEVLSIIGR